MGIKGLWTALESAAEVVCLHDFAMQEGFIVNKGGKRGLRIGIDIGGWIYRALYHHGHARNPELATIFARCTRLRTAAILPVFVFDGPGRPGQKRNKKVRRTENWLVTDIKAMLDCFGFPWYQAPGEAEAQLAWMSRQNIVDAVLTDDSDALVFGATTVLHMTPRDNGPFTASVYTTAAINALGFGPDQLLVIAILAGGDYSSGLPGCGIVTAVALAKTGLGGKLAQAAATGDHATLCAWKQDLVLALRNNPYGYLNHCQPKLADSVPADFPNLDIVHLYQYPFINTHLTHEHVKLAELDIIALATFCKQHFTWNTGILQRFALTVFPGLAMQELIDQAVALDNGTAHHPVASQYICDVISQRENPVIAGFIEVRVNLTIDANIITGICNVTQGKNDITKIMAWLPLVLVKHVYPNLAIPSQNTEPPSTGTQAKDYQEQDIIEITSSPESSGIINLSSSPEPQTEIENDYIIEITSSPESSGIINLTSSPEPQAGERAEIKNDHHSLDKEVFYTTRTTICPISGHITLEFDTDSDGSL